MKVIIFALALVAIAVAVPVEQEPIRILRNEFDQTPEGGYGFNFESEDGIKREEVGQLKTVQDEENKPREVVVVRGSFSYTDKQGNLETINYYADETGYHAEGPSIPVAPVARR